MAALNPFAVCEAPSALGAAVRWLAAGRCSKLRPVRSYAARTLDPGSDAPCVLARGLSVCGIGAYDWSMNAKRPGDRDGSRGRQGGTSSMQEAEYSVDERYYPATDECDWEPLRQHLGGDESLGEWMFMAATTDGRRFYKHSISREPLALMGSGHA